MHENATERAAGVGNASSNEAKTPLVRRLRHALGRMIDTLLFWQERRGQRRALATLSDETLKDIGVTRLEAERESIKRPWCE